MIVSLTLFAMDLSMDESMMQGALM
jgi:hypothetical protein